MEKIVNAWEICRLRSKNEVIDVSCEVLTLKNLKLIDGDEKILFTPNNNVKSVTFSEPVVFDDGFRRIFIRTLRQQKTVTKVSMTRISLKDCHVEKFLIRDPISSSLTNLCLLGVELDENDYLFFVKALNLRRPLDNLILHCAGVIKNKLILLNLCNVKKLSFLQRGQSTLDAWIFSQSLTPNVCKIKQLLLYNYDYHCFPHMRRVMSKLNHLAHCKVTFCYFDIDHMYSARKKKFIQSMRNLYKLDS